MSLTKVYLSEVCFLLPIVNMRPNLVELKRGNGKNKKELIAQYQEKMTIFSDLKKIKLKSIQN